MSELFHVGVGKLRGAPGRGSGRYPLGSGKRPYQDYGGGKISRKKGLADASLDSVRDPIHDNNKYNAIRVQKNIMQSTSQMAKKAGRKLNEEMSKESWERMDLSKLTDQDLQRAINRENLEIQYSKLFNSKPSEINKGKEYAAKVLDVAGDVLALGASAATIYMLMKGKL